MFILLFPFLFEIFIAFFSATQNVQLNVICKKSSLRVEDRFLIFFVRSFSDSEALFEGQLHERYFALLFGAYARIICSVYQLNIRIWHSTASLQTSFFPVQLLIDWFDSVQNSFQSERRKKLIAFPVYYAWIRVSEAPN